MVTPNNSIERVRSVIKKYRGDLTVDVVLSNTDAYKHTSYYVVLNRMPKFTYERIGNLLLAYDGGFYDTLSIQPGSTGAFGGRKFDIPLSDGTVYKATGDVWSAGQSEIPEPCVHIGYGTVETLQNCYVYYGAEIAKRVFDEAIARLGVREQAYWEYEKEIKCRQ